MTTHDAGTHDTEFVIEPGRQDVVMRRVFDAPREIVFAAMTDPDLVPNWWGPRRLSTKVECMDVRPGGRWRFANGDADGTEYWFNGVYHDVVAPERIVQTFEYEGTPGEVSLETVTLEEVDGRTTYLAQSVFQSVENRDGMVREGMQDGAGETMDRLAEVVSRLAAG